MILCIYRDVAAQGSHKENITLKKNLIGIEGISIFQLKEVFDT